MASGAARTTIIVWAETRTSGRRAVLAQRTAVLLSVERDSQGNPVTDPRGRQIFVNRAFENLCFENDAFPLPEIHSRETGNEHYHVYFYPEN